MSEIKHEDNEMTYTSTRECQTDNATKSQAKTFALDATKVFGVSHKGMTPITDQQN